MSGKLNYRNTLFFSFILLASLLVSDMFFKIPAWIYAGIFLAMIGLMIRGSISIQSGFYIRALCSASVKNKSVSLTFDDGPEETTTPQILNILREKNVPAAFFCIGKKVKAAPGLIKAIYEGDHVIGGHSYTHHYFFDLFSSKRMETEMEDTEKAVYSVIGKKINMFRPPYGVTNPNLARALKKKNCHVVGWSIRTNDTVQDEKRIFRKIDNNLKGGDIILLHDTMKQTATLLPRLIDHLRNAGYEFVRVDKMLKIDAYE